MTWTYDTIRQTLSEMAITDYQNLVKVFLVMELSLENRALLSVKMYLPRRGILLCDF